MAESYEKLYSKLIETVKKYAPNTNFDMIQKAYEIALDAHKDQKRHSGMPYVLHPLSVAVTVETTPATLFARSFAIGLISVSILLKYSS